MAALVKHVLTNCNQNIARYRLANLTLIQQRNYRDQNLSKRNKVKPKKIQKVPVPETRKLKSIEDSISSRGFLRCQKDYTPPEDVEELLESTFADIVGTSPTQEAPIPTELKFALLNSCFETLKHGVPNSILHTINTYDPDKLIIAITRRGIEAQKVTVHIHCCYTQTEGKLRDFYLTSVDTTLPLDKFRTVELPPNLHVQYEPIRFHPDDDTLFKGQTAFPKSNTIVTGLRTKRKYRGHKQTDVWPA